MVIFPPSAQYYCHRHPTPAIIAGHGHWARNRIFLPRKIQKKILHESVLAIKMAEAADEAPPELGPQLAQPEAPPLGIIVSGRVGRHESFMGTYVKQSKVVHGTPLYVLVDASGSDRFLYKNGEGIWSFVDKEEMVERESSLIQSSRKAGLPSEDGVQFEFREPNMFDRYSGDTVLDPAITARAMTSSVAKELLCAALENSRSSSSSSSSDAHISSVREALRDALNIYEGLVDDNALIQEAVAHADKMEGEFVAAAPEGIVLENGIGELEGLCMGTYVKEQEKVVRGAPVYAKPESTNPRACSSAKKKQGPGGSRTTYKTVASS